MWYNLGQLWQKDCYNNQNMQHVDLSRRDTLKLGEVAAGALAFPWKGLAEFFKIPNTPTELAIFNFLNLVPEQCQLSINAGDHTILDKSMEALTSMSPVILTGEQKPSLLAEFLTIDPQSYLGDGDQRNVCVDPGVGSAPIELSTNAKNLQQLIQTGSTIVTSDAEDIALVTEDLQHLPKDTVLKRTGLGIGAAVLIATLAIVKKNSNTQEKMSMKTILKYAPLFIFGGGVALATGVLLGQTTDCGPSGETQATETLGRVPAIEQNVADEISFEKFVNNIKGAPPVMDYYDGLVHVRNLEMAYNLWRVVAESVGKGQTGVKIFEKHGNAHGAVEDLFMDGPEVLQGELVEYMKKVVQVGNSFNKTIKAASVQAYIDAGGGNQLDNDKYDKLFSKVQDQWFENVSSIANYVRFFQETIKVGDDQVLSPREIESMRRPPSARTLMFREMINEINLAEDDKGSLSSKKGMLKSALMVAIAKDAELETELIKAKSNLKGEPRQETVIGQIDLQQSTTLWFDQLMKGNFIKEMYTIENQLIVGCVEINGRTCPVVREFTTSQDQVIGVDKVLLGNDKVAVGSKTYSYSTNKPEGLPEDYLGTVDIITNFGKSQTEEVDFVQAKDFAEPNVFWSQDPTDLAKVNLIRINK